MMGDEVSAPSPPHSLGRPIQQHASRAGAFPGREGLQERYHLNLPYFALFYILTKLKERKEF